MSLKKHKNQKYFYRILIGMLLTIMIVLCFVEQSRISCAYNVLNINNLIRLPTNVDYARKRRTPNLNFQQLTHSINMSNYFNLTQINQMLTSSNDDNSNEFKLLKHKFNQMMAKFDLVYQLSTFEFYYGQFIYDFIQEYIINIEPTILLTLCCGSLISSMRGGIISDSDLDIVFLYKNISNNTDNSILYNFVFDQFYNNGMCVEETMLDMRREHIGHSWVRCQINLDSEFVKQGIQTVLVNSDDMNSIEALQVYDQMKSYSEDYGIFECDLNFPIFVNITNNSNDENSDYFTWIKKRDDDTMIERDRNEINITSHYSYSSYQFDVNNTFIHHGVINKKDGPEGNLLWPIFVTIPSNWYNFESDYDCEYNWTCKCYLYHRMWDCPCSNKNIVKTINARTITTGSRGCEYCLSCLWKPLSIPTLFNFVRIDGGTKNYFKDHFYKYFNQKAYLEKIKDQINILDQLGYQTFEILINDNDNDLTQLISSDNDPSDEIIINQRKMCQS